MTIALEQASLSEVLYREFNQLGLEVAKKQQV